MLKDERTNQNVKRTLRKYVNQHQDDWDIHLQVIVYGINTTKQVIIQNDKITYIAYMFYFVVQCSLTKPFVSN